MQLERDSGSQTALRELSALQNQCTKVLGGLLSAYPSLEFASLSLLDGRTFAHKNGVGAADAHRVAAVTTSLLGLSESVAKEALTSSCKHSVIAADSGTIVTVRVPSRRRILALSVCAGPAENLATVLRKALDTAATVAVAVDQAE